MPSSVRRKPTRLAADFIQALLFSVFRDFVEDTGAASFVATDCKEEENVGVMKCGERGIPESSFMAIFFAEFGESRD